MTHFFSGIDQQPIKFGKFTGLSPMFFKDISVMGGLFFADYDAVRAIIPPAFKIVKLPLNKTLVGIHCAEYSQTDVGAYNEIAFSTLILPPKNFISTTLKSVKNILTKSYHIYILDLPVTTEIAVEGGVKIFNFPKILSEIEFRQRGPHRICTLRDIESKDIIMELECKVFETKEYQNKKIKPFQIFTYRKETGIKPSGKFTINPVQIGQSFLIPNVNVRFGSHQFADQYKAMNLSTPIHTFYAAKCEGILSIEE